mmetsp:Transcript_9676/g.12716  ORF Transcript_9676/g.12716 Transcript_9676/m.12716 type:complete len:205 (-) Transcript_9676:27-641(-)
MFFFFCFGRTCIETRRMMPTPEASLRSSQALYMPLTLQKLTLFGKPLLQTRRLQSACKGGTRRTATPQGTKHLHWRNEPASRWARASSSVRHAFKANDMNRQHLSTLTADHNVHRSDLQRQELSKVDPGKPHAGARAFMIELRSEHRIFPESLRCRAPVWLQRNTDSDEVTDASIPKVRWKAPFQCSQSGAPPAGAEIAGWRGV